MITTALKAQTDWRSGIAPHGRIVNDAVILDQNNIIMVGGNRTNDSLQAVFKSVDGGNTWDIILDVLGEWLQTVHFIDAQKGFAAGHSGVLIKTVNGGSAWTEVTFSGDAAQRDYNSLFFTDTLTGYMAGGNRSLNLRTILKTTDAGETWTIVKDDEGAMLKSIFFASSDTGYAVGETGTVLKTTNGGADWTAISLPSPLNQRDYNSVYFIDHTTGILLGGLPAADSTQTLLRTTDGGSTWDVLKDETGPVLKDVHFSNVNDGFAVGEWATVLQTDDGGLTWNNAVIPDTINDIRFNNTVYFLHPYFGLIAGNMGKIMFYQPASPPIPVVTLFQPTNMNGFQAILNGTVNPNTTNIDYSSVVEFQYGTSVSVSNHIALEPDQFIGVETETVSTLLTDLQPQTTYYYRLKASSLLGEFYTPIQSFNTRLDVISNWDFEEWDTIVYNRPEGWNFAPNIEKVPSFDGGAAVKLTSGLEGDNVHTGVVLLALPSEQDAIQGGYPFTARPDSVMAYFNYDIAPNDSAIMLVILKKNSIPVSQDIFYITGSSSGNFIPLSFAINYLSQESPDSIIIGVANTNPFTETTQELESWLMVDKISFPGITENVPNNDFEQWSEFLVEDLVGWYGESKLDEITGPPANYKKTTDSYSGNYAFELDYLSGHYDNAMRLIANSTSEAGWFPAFPVYHKPNTFNGFFKYFPENGDSMTVYVSLYKNGLGIGSGYFVCDTAVTEYSPFTVPITYNGGTDNPDSAYLEIKPTGDSLMGNTRFFIDAVSFDGFATADTIIIDAIETVKGELYPVSIKAYPNPATDFMNTEIYNAEKGAFFSILNMNGQTLFSQQLQGSFNGTYEKITVDLSTYKSGIYIINYSGRQAAVSGKFIVKK
jgi:photosystem II stability/assembly factor-like uncharacterized protein